MFIILGYKLILISVFLYLSIKKSISSNQRIIKLDNRV